MGKNVLIVDDVMTKKYEAALRGTDIDVVFTAENQSDAYDSFVAPNIYTVSLDNQFPRTPSDEPEALGNETAKFMREVEGSEGLKIYGISAFPRDFDESLFDGVYSKREITPAEYRELMTGEKAKVPGKDILVLSETGPISQTISRVFDTFTNYDFKAMTEVPERGELKNYALIIAQEKEYSHMLGDLVYKLWDIKEAPGHDVVPASDESPILTPVIKWGMKDITTLVPTLIKKIGEYRSD